MTNRAIALLALSLAALCLSGAGLASAEPARVCRVTETTSYPSVKLSCSKTALLVDLVAAMGTAQAACFPANDLEHWECIR